MAMATKHSLVFGILLFLINLLALTGTTMADGDIPSNFSSKYFPDDFIFGTATSAYQVEGEANRKDRGPSVWDIFTHESPDRILDGSNGDRADDFYNIFKADIARMSLMGLKAFRFSISWSRIVPSGRVWEGVNQQGIEFYNKIINETIANGLEPFVTIFHWDTPQALEDKYGSFLSRNIVDNFRDYADFLFANFGDRVKYWITLNGPSTFIEFGYGEGIYAPGRCSSWVNNQCLAGNSSTEPYIVAHNLLLCHAAAVQTYRENYQKTQLGKIGISLFSYWYEPFSSEAIDKDAANTALDFMLGLFMDPITYGRYPRTVQTLVGNRLPTFSDAESELLTKSYDFIGLQYYSSYYAKANATVDPRYISYKNDSGVIITPYGEDGQPIGKRAYSPWLYIYPAGIRNLLNYTKNTYNNPIIYVTENGVDEYNNQSYIRQSYFEQEGTDDKIRVDYLKNHLWNMYGSISEDNVTVKGYFAWSYLDNFEWNMGYTSRFGLHYVDYRDNMTRYPKRSATWFCLFLRTLSDLMCPVNPYSYIERE